MVMTLDTLSVHPDGYLLDFAPVEVVFFDRADGGVDRAVGMAACGIRLVIASGDMVGIVLLQRENGSVIDLAGAAEETEGAQHGVVGSLETGAGEIGAGDAVMGGATDVEGLHGGNIFHHLMDAAGSGACSSQSGLELIAVKIQQSSHTHGSGDGADGAGGVEAASAVAGLDAPSQTDAGLIADDDAADGIFHGKAFLFGNGKNGRNDGGAEMDGGEPVAIIEVIGMAADTVREGGILQRCLSAEADHGGIAAGEAIEIAVQLFTQQGGAGNHRADFIHEALSCLLANLLGEGAAFQRI